MAGTTNIKDRHLEYVESGRWKCTKSPTGAHIWREADSLSLAGWFYCKHCLEVKWFPTDFNDAVMYNNRPVGFIPKQGRRTK